LAELQRYRIVGVVAGVEQVIDTSSQRSSVADSAMHVLDRAVRLGNRRTKVVGQLERSGMRIRPEEWVGIQLSAIVVGAAGVTILIQSVLGVLLGAPIGFVLCQMFMSRKIRKRATAFEEQLPDALQLLSGALRSGFALNQSFGAVARDGGEPVASEFARVLQEVRLGAELEDAMDSLAERMNSDDMRMVVMVIRIAREIGGNLAEVLENTVATMRARVYLRGQIRTLSAESRISAKVLIALPLLMAAYLMLVKRSYLRPMYTTGVGVAVLIGGAVLVVIGALWLNRLTKIEV
jgi:tight adherence protein B